MPNGSRGGGWKEQYDRMLRWFDLFERIETGQKHDESSDYYEDRVRAFFETCYHLKDWIKNDPQTEVSRGDVEQFIRETPALGICADIANANKHFLLTSRRSREDPKPGPRKFAIQVGGEPAIIQVAYTIETSSGPRDAFQLAQECVDGWNRFLTHLGLL